MLLSLWKTAMHFISVTVANILQRNGYLTFPKIKQHYTSGWVGGWGIEKNFKNKEAKIFQGKHIYYGLRASKHNNKMHRPVIINKTL